MIALLVWALVGVLFGIVLIAVLPWVGAKLIGDTDQIEAVSDWYIDLAQTCARRSCLIIRDGDFKLIGKRYDPDHKADKDTATGDPRHHRDSLDVLNRIKDKVFGFGLTSRDTYISPLAAELGELAKEAHDSNDIRPTTTKDGQRGMIDGFTVPKQSQLVDLDAAKHITTGDADPETGYEAYEKTKISQERFHEKVSFGQLVVLVGATLATMALAWLLASRDAPSADTTVSTSLMFLAASVGNKTTKKAGIIAAGIASLLVLPLIALLSHGLLAGIVVLVTSLGVAVAVPVGIKLFGPSIPMALGVPMARGFWTLAQLTVGRGVLVERDSGHIEHRQLRETSDEAFHNANYECVLSDGKLLPVDGTQGDLFRFGWADMGATVEKTEQNMGSLTKDLSVDGAKTDGGYVVGEGTRQGYKPIHPVPADAEYLVTLPRLWTWCRGSSESEAVRQGRNKALTEEGGAQQISMVVFTGAMLACITLGGLFGLVAGGAIL